MDKEELKAVILAEGNELQFEYKGYQCRVKRIEGLGHLCGYVDVAMPNAEDIVNCHGGITFNSGESIGFDCAHLGDLTPMSLLSFGKEFGCHDGEVYRTMDFCVEELMRIVNQIPSRLG